MGIATFAPVNKEVNVSSFYFRKQTNSTGLAQDDAVRVDNEHRSGAVRAHCAALRQSCTLKSYPHRIEYEGRLVTFMDSGLRLLVKSGQRLAELFDMSDGQDIYRLKLEDNHWTLIGVKAAGSSAARRPMGYMVSGGLI